jgi:hypothetical protein
MIDGTIDEIEGIPLPHKIEFSDLSEYDDWREVVYEIEKARLYLDYLENSYKTQAEIESESLLKNMSKPSEIRGPEFSN